MPPSDSAQAMWLKRESTETPRTWASSAANRAASAW